MSLTLPDRAAGIDGFRERAIAILAALIAANILIWGWAFAAFNGQPLLIGTALLAYSLGLRHALDADHIAAIDNVTRKLMQQGKRPVSVGFFFALGHSTIVLLASVAIAFAANSLTGSFAAYREIGGIVGASASALFLFVIAGANIAVLAGVIRAFRRVRAGEPIAHDDIDALMAQHGWLSRLFKPLFGYVSKGWHLFPVGFLFALGFDTASEISLFGLSAGASGEISSWSILVFPALFTAGMTLVDTIDGILMIGAYGWAYRDPLRKLFYNMTITSVSVLVAVVIGGIEILGLLAGHLGFEGKFWDWISTLNAHFGALGYGIVALFIASWAMSFAIYQLSGRGRRLPPGEIAAKP